MPPAEPLTPGSLSASKVYYIAANGEIRECLRQMVGKHKSHMLPPDRSIRYDPDIAGFEQ